MKKIFIFLVFVLLAGCSTEIIVHKPMKNTAVETNTETVMQNKSSGITASAVAEVNQNNPSKTSNSQKTTYNEVNIDIKKNKKSSGSTSTGTTQTTTSTSTTSQNTTQNDNQDDEEYQILGKVICIKNDEVLIDKINCENDFDCEQDVLMDMCNNELVIDNYRNETDVPDCAIKVICEHSVCKAVCEI